MGWFCEVVGRERFPAVFLGGLRGWRGGGMVGVAGLGCWRARDGDGFVGICGRGVR